MSSLRWTVGWPPLDSRLGIVLRSLSFDGGFFHRSGSWKIFKQPPRSALPDGWKPLTFKKVPKSTVYELVTMSALPSWSKPQAMLCVRPDERGQNRSLGLSRRPLAVEGRESTDPQRRDA